MVRSDILSGGSLIRGSIFGGCVSSRLSVFYFSSGVSDWLTILNFSGAISNWFLDCGGTIFSILNILCGSWSTLRNSSSISNWISLRNIAYISLWMVSSGWLNLGLWNLSSAVVVRSVNYFSRIFVFFFFNINSVDVLSSILRLQSGYLRLCVNHLILCMHSISIRVLVWLTLIWAISNIRLSLIRSSGMSLLSSVLIGGIWIRLVSCVSGVHLRFWCSLNISIFGRLEGIIIWGVNLLRGVLHKMRLTLKRSLHISVLIISWSGLHFCGLRLCIEEVIRRSWVEKVISFYVLFHVVILVLVGVLITILIIMITLLLITKIISLIIKIVLVTKISSILLHILVVVVIEIFLRRVHQRNIWLVIKILILVEISSLLVIVKLLFWSIYLVIVLFRI